MDIQKLMDALSEQSSRERKNYHVTLGDLRDACKANPEGLVVVDLSGGLADVHSYRGYYCDPSFRPSHEPTPAKDVLAECERGLSEVFGGYKGGNYCYDERSPLWYASYGDCGPAIVGLDVVGETIHLTTRMVD